MKETDLYPPLRDYLERQGYEVKGEVKHCDLVAKRGAEPLVIIELKLTLNLDLILQATDRLKLSDSVYIAFPNSAPLWKRKWKTVRGLCQRLGLGIITLDNKALKVNVRCDPVPYKPRRSAIRQQRLLTEFEKRVGDQNLGGTTGTPIVTAYKQDAVRCLSALAKGPLALGLLRKETGVQRAGNILQHDHYGWFERVSRGVYQLTPNGQSALKQHRSLIKELQQYSEENND